jgi:hypothetical protein
MLSPPRVDFGHMSWLTTQDSGGRDWHYRRLRQCCLNETIRSMKGCMGAIRVHLPKQQYFVTLIYISVTNTEIPFRVYTFACKSAKSQKAAG